MNNLEKINIKNRTWYYFDNIIKFEDFGLDHILNEILIYKYILV